MSHTHQRRQNLAQGIFSLWANWAIAVGFLVLPIIITPLVSPRLLPVIPIVMVGILTLLDRRNRLQMSPTCFRIPHLVQVILISSAVVLLIDIIYKTHIEINSFIGQPVSLTNPVIPVLDISAVAAIVCFWGMLCGNNPRSCRSCRNRLGEAIDRGLIGMLYSRESKLQIKFLFWLSLGLAVSTWLYYIFSISMSTSTRPTAIFSYYARCFVTSSH